MSWVKTFRAMISIVILGFVSWMFKVDFQLMLLFSIAYDLTYMRISKYDEQDREDTPRD